jgi:hypothetical protein
VVVGAGAVVDVMIDVVGAAGADEMVVSSGGPWRGVPALVDGGVVGSVVVGGGGGGGAVSEDVVSSGGGPTSGLPARCSTLVVGAD